MGAVEALRGAHKELGMGLPPETFGSDLDAILADECAPANAKVTVTESARYTIDFPDNDPDVVTTFGKTIDVWGTADGKPPAGVAFATNTLGTPGLLPGDAIILGWRIRVLVEVEGRTIAGNLYTPVEGSTLVPASTDAWSLVDRNLAMNVPAEQPYVKGDLLVGLPTWKFANAFVNAYEVVWSIDHQTQMWREPLTQASYIEPFNAAEAAGTAFATNQDRVKAFNDRMAALGRPEQFLPQNFTRTGSATNPATGNTVGLFSPSTSEDSSPTIWGGNGVPNDMSQKSPYMFAQPIFWPRGQPMQLQFQVNDSVWQAEMQRWLSVTGGTNGAAGLDLNLPFSSTLGTTMPSALGADTMLEQTDDPAPLLIGKQTNSNRAVCKIGRAVIEVGCVVKRVPPSWRRVVANAIKNKVIGIPVGPGDLGSLVGT